MFSILSDEFVGWYILYSALAYYRYTLVTKTKLILKLPGKVKCRHIMFDWINSICSKYGDKRTSFPSSIGFTVHIITN